MIGKDFEIEIISDKGKVYVKGDCYPASEIINDYIAATPGCHLTLGENWVNEPYLTVLEKATKDWGIKYRITQRESNAYIEVKVKVREKDYFIKIDPQKVDFEYYDEMWSYWDESADGLYDFEITSDKDPLGNSMTLINAYMNVYEKDADDPFLTTSELEWRVGTPCLVTPMNWSKVDLKKKTGNQMPD